VITPIFRVISLMGVPDAACRKAKAICAGVHRFFMSGSSFLNGKNLPKEYHPE
jgi:hypothetical protein